MKRRRHEAMIDISWKSTGEYNPDGFLRGMPYYYITSNRGPDSRENKTQLLWRLDTQTREYVLVKESDNFSELYDLGSALNDEIREWRRITLDNRIPMDEMLQLETTEFAEFLPKIEAEILSLSTSPEVKDESNNDPKN